MKYDRFEQLPVWQAAVELAAAVYALTEQPQFRRQYSLRDQIERATVSVSNNIAEGFERGTKQELLTFLYIARGSAGEVRSMLCLLEKIPGFAGRESEILSLKSRAESISKQLGAWARSLRDSDLKGERYVDEKTRKADIARRDRDEFLQELEQIRNGGARKCGFKIQVSKFQTGNNPESSISADSRFKNNNNPESSGSADPKFKIQDSRPEASIPAGI
ncbi:MAG: four helix bundle protein [Terriglobia bacterium]